MTFAQWLTVALLVQYLVLAVAYGIQGEPAKSIYWIGAAILNTGVLLA